MSDMVERVARAIAAAGTIVDWDEMSVACQEQFTKEARAAIEAMREPTEAMVDAAWASWEDVEGSKGFVGAWQAMIDEALKQKEVSS
jgi:hypothetical protein